MALSAGLHHAVTVYGEPGCPDTTRSRALLDTLGVEYNFYDISLDAAMARTAAALRPDGGEKIPVVNLGNGLVLVEPSNATLENALHQSGHLR